MKDKIQQKRLDMVAELFQNKKIILAKCIIKGTQEEAIMMCAKEANGLIPIALMVELSVIDKLEFANDGKAVVAHQQDIVNKDLN